MRTHPALLALATTTSATFAGPTPITIDGRFDDWQDVPAAQTDPAGDAASGQTEGPDLVALSITDDDRFLYLRLEATQPFDLSENNTLEILIDGDNNPLTGTPSGDLGR